MRHSPLRGESTKANVDLLHFLIGYKGRITSSLDKTVTDLGSGVTMGFSPGATQHADPTLDRVPPAMLVLGYL